MVVIITSVIVRKNKINRWLIIVWLYEFGFFSLSWICWKVLLWKNFKHLPEPFRIRVVEPVKRTTYAYREQAIVEAGMNPFLLTVMMCSSICWTDSGTGSITQRMQAARCTSWMGDEAYSGSRSYYAPSSGSTSSVMSWLFYSPRSRRWSRFTFLFWLRSVKLKRGSIAA